MLLFVRVPVCFSHLKRVCVCVFEREVGCDEERGSELRSCVKAEVDALGSPSLIIRTVSVDV